MRRELIIPALILGVSLVLASGLLVVGVHWALASAARDTLTPHLQAIEADVGAIGERLDGTNARLDTTAGHLDTVTTKLDSTVAQLETSTSSLTASLSENADLLSRTVEARLEALNTTVAGGFDKPVLISLTNAVDLAGPITVQGPEEDAPPVPVDTNILGGG
ncbi:MAG: hypothetical protein ACFCVE_07545 [Phycisphaerae bacterium]